MHQISARTSRALLIITLVGLAGTAMPALSADTDYEIDYTVGFRPDDKSADVTMTVRPDTGYARRFTFTMDPALYTGIEGDGGITIDGDQVEWRVPEDGGHFRYRYGPIDHRRGGEGYDARITTDWTILRGDDLFPAGKALLSRSTDSRTRLHFELPEGWTMVDTGFGRVDQSDSFVVTNPEMRFDRPVGWIIAGKVGNRFERIAGVELSVASPKGSAMHRTDILAFCSWILPEMQRAFDMTEERYGKVRDFMRQWSTDVETLRAKQSHGARRTVFPGTRRRDTCQHRRRQEPGRRCPPADARTARRCRRPARRQPVSCR